MNFILIKEVSAVCVSEGLIVTLVLIEILSVGVAEVDLLSHRRGRSRGRAQGVHTSPEMTCSFLIQLVFTSGHQSVAPFLSGAPS